MAMDAKKRYMFKANVQDYYDEIEGKARYYTDYGYVDSYTEGGVLEALSAYYGNDLMEVNLTPLEDGFVCLLSENMYNEILENRETYG